MFGAFISFAVLLTVLLVAGIGVVYFVDRKNHKFSFRMLFSGYFYIVALLSLLAIFAGCSLTTKALLSDVFGRDFSYHTYSDFTLAEPVPDVKTGESVAEEKANLERAKQESIKYQQEQVESEYINDLYNGLSMLLVGGLFLAVHIWGWRKLESNQEPSNSFLYKGYVMVQLGIYGLATLIALPLGISQWLRFALTDSASNSSSAPGEVVSFALWATPIWLFFIWLTVRTMRHQSST